MSDKITLDREAFKVLASDTRIEMLKILAERKKTLTDLSQQMGLSPSTVKEHLDRLVDAGLIEYLDRGTKWKYYVLTSKGKSVVKPVEAKIWIMLSASAAVLASVAVDVFRRLNFTSRNQDLMRVPQKKALGKSLADEAVERGVKRTAEKAPMLYSNAADLVNQTTEAASKALSSAVSQTTTTLSNIRVEPDLASWATTTTSTLLSPSHSLGVVQPSIPFWEVALALASFSVFLVCAFIVARRSLTLKL